MRSVREKSVAAAVLAAGLAAGAAQAQTIVDEWASVKAPPAPELKRVNVDPKTTALLLLDFVKQICNPGPRPRCVASLPKVKHLLTVARAKGAAVVYSLAGNFTAADIWPEVAPAAGEPAVSSGPDKFLNTDLERILREKGIKTVIVTGVAAEGAVLNTASQAALRGFKVVVPVDGMSSSTLYAEQYTAWHLVDAPRISLQVTLTRSDEVTF